MVVATGWFVACAASPSRLPVEAPATRPADARETPATDADAGADTAATPTPAPDALASAADTVGAPCADDMVTLPQFCIDRYEAPNVAGALPLSLQTADDGEQWCALRGKRLCSEDEWVRACGGPHGRPFPYGEVHRRSACNDDRPWIEVSWKALAKWPQPVAMAEASRLFQADPSGARADCVSEEGVHDLTGNVAEWVRRSGPAPRPGYEHVLKGCYWAGCYHQPEPDCRFRNSAHPGSFRTYEAGFRCCSDRAQPAEGAGASTH